MNIETNGYIIIRNAISRDVLELLKIQILLDEKNKCYENNVDNFHFFFNDKPCNKSFSVYGLLSFEALLLQMQPLISKYCQIDLVPTYSYSRIYYSGSKLDKHFDRASCEYSVTCCISCDGEPWDIYMKSKNNNEICIKLNEGDIAIYKGIEVEHWRNDYLGNRQIQAFLHYVNSSGIYKEHIYDKRPFIGSNNNNNK